MLLLALSLDKNDTGALANLGAVYSQQGKYAQSLPYYRQAFLQDPRWKSLAPNYSQALVARAAEERRAGSAARTSRKRCAARAPSFAASSRWASASTACAASPGQPPATQASQ